MLSKFTALVVCAFPIALTGCHHLSMTPESPHRDNTASSYALSSSPDGTFMVDAVAGKVWRYDSKQNAFLEVPVTTKIRTYERGPDGEMRLTTPTNDPLGIRGTEEHGPWEKYAAH